MSSGSGSELFRTQEVMQILGVSRRQLQYWAQTDLVCPSARTPGGHNRYTFRDLVALRTTKRLLDAGASIQRIRSSIQALRKILPTVQRPLAELVLVATGDVVVVIRDGAAFEAVSGQQWVFEVAQFQREVDAWRRSVASQSVSLKESRARGPGRRRTRPEAVRAV